MKNTHLLSTVVLGLLMVFAVSCTTMQEATGPVDDQSSAAAPARIYVEDPNNWGRTIVLERDPFTGRYYQVSPYGLSSGYSRYNNRYYNDRYNNDRYYRGYPTYPSRGSVQQRQPDQRPVEQRSDDARERVLGGKKN